MIKAHGDFFRQSKTQAWEVFKRQRRQEPTSAEPEGQNMRCTRRTSPSWVKCSESAGDKKHRGLLLWPFMLLVPKHQVLNQSSARNLCHQFVSLPPVQMAIGKTLSGLFGFLSWGGCHVHCELVTLISVLPCFIWARQSRCCCQNVRRNTRNTFGLVHKAELAVNVLRNEILAGSKLARNGETVE